MDRYKITKTIGEGTFGIVYKAKENNGQVVAIKQFKLSGDEELAKRELKICSSISHPNIVTFRESFKFDDVLHLVFDFVPYSLAQLIDNHPNGIDEELGIKIVYQLTKAIECCHNNNIMHRDIKPENILLDKEQNVKLCDFGVATQILYKGTPLTDYVATRWYRPPEQELRCTDYDFSADIWSIGCIAVELRSGKALFPGNSQLEQLQLIQNALGPLPQKLLDKVNIPGVTFVNGPNNTIQDRFKDVLTANEVSFVEHVIQYDSNARLSIDQCLNHPYFRTLRKEDLKRIAQRKATQKLNLERAIQGDEVPIEEEMDDFRPPDTVTDALEISDEIGEDLTLPTSALPDRITSLPKGQYEDDFEEYELEESS